MRSRSDRAYVGEITALGVALVASALVLLIFMLRALIGPFEVLPQVAQGPDAAARWVEPRGAAQLAPERREALRRAWRDLLPPEATRPALASVSPAELEGASGLAIVSDARALDADEVEALLEFARRGGEVILAGWVASERGEPGAAMRRLLGRDVVAIPRDRAWFAAAGRRGPLNARTDPGLRIGLAAAETSPGVDEPDAELFWASWDLRPADASAAAALRLQAGRGRIAWIGVDPARAIGSPGRAWLTRVYGNAWSWVTGRPTGELHAWPDAAPFAGLLAMDTETGFANAAPVARSAIDADFPVTFLLLASLAREHPELAAQLARAGEVGSHADVHDGFKDLALEVQRERIDASRRQIEALGAGPVRGFRPPYESYDASTLRALADLGLDYQLGNLELVSAAPQVVRPEGSGRSIVQVPRAILDDYDLFVRRGVETPDQMLELLRAEMRRMRGIGGLHYFSFHTQFIDGSGRVEALSRHARELRDSGAWLATGADLASWWRSRSAVVASVEPAGPSRAELRVTNQGSGPVRGLAARVYTGAPAREVRVSSTHIGHELTRRWTGRGVSTRFEPGAEHADLLLPEIPAGASRSFTIDYDTAPVPAAPEPD